MVDSLKMFIVCRLGVFTGYMTERIHHRRCLPGVLTGYDRTVLMVQYGSGPEVGLYQRWADAREERLAGWTPASMFYVLLRQYELSAARRLSSGSLTSQTESV